MKVTVTGEEVTLLAERAVWWEAQRALLVADTHFGKASVFRARGIPIPTGNTSKDLSRLSILLSFYQARCLIILGDFFHARESQDEETLAALAHWRAQHGDLAITLVRGNHDRHAGDPPPELEIECVPAPLSVPPFTLLHHPATIPDHYTIAGHVHPSLILRLGRSVPAQARAFIVGPQRMILPAFGGLTGNAEFLPEPEDRCFACAGVSVLPIPDRLLSTRKR
jgi:DNA ligase-associated metallophosphoesterase